MDLDCRLGFSLSTKIHLALCHKDLSWVWGSSRRNAHRNHCGEQMWCCIGIYTHLFDCTVLYNLQCNCFSAHPKSMCSTSVEAMAGFQHYRSLGKTQPWKHQWFDLNGLPAIFIRYGGSLIYVIYNSAYHIYRLYIYIISYMDSYHVPDIEVHLGWCYILP